MSDLSDSALIERIIPFDNWEERERPEQQEFWDLSAALVTRLMNDPVRLEAALDDVQRLATATHCEAYWVVISAGRASDPQPMFNACVEWIARPTAFWRRAALDILAQLGDCRPMREQSLPFAFGGLRDKDESVVAAALYAIGHLNTDVPILDATSISVVEDLITTSSVEVRRAAVSALSAPYFPAGIPGLIKLSHDENVEIR